MASKWAALREARRTALIPYLTAGFPSVQVSCDALQAVAEHADIIEVGVPFSDPLADGPTIQAASFQALEQGMTLPGTLDLISRAGLNKPVVLFSYLNPLLSYGIERLISDASSVGVAGLLITDLPVGADLEIETIIRNSPLTLIRLVSPTSTPERITQTVASSEGFLYLVSRLGVTGVSAELDSGLAESVAKVRRATSLPIAVGFGISTSEQAAKVAAIADGVVVGSALVNALANGGVPRAANLLGHMRFAIDNR